MHSTVAYGWAFFRSIFSRIIRLVQVRFEKSGISAGLSVIRVSGYPKKITRW
jgi:hypothetical protein